VFSPCSKWQRRKKVEASEPDVEEKPAKKSKKSEQEAEEKPAKKSKSKKSSTKEEAKEEAKEEPKEEKKEEPKKEEAKKEEPKEGKQEAKRRGPVVDRMVGGGGWTVHEDFAVKLMQTNVGENNNKFYFIQLLVQNGQYAVFTRWGRLGEDGQNKLDRQPSLDKAIVGFEKKFKDKTANNWSNRASFVKKAGKYQFVETEESEGGDGDSSVPMGKLSKAQIEKGQEVLKRLEDALNANKKALYAGLSSEFYSLIPTSFGRKKPEAISTIEALREKEELLKFYLRMGFESVDEEPGLTPIHGVHDLPCPSSLTNAASGICDNYSIKAADTQAAQLEKKQAGDPVKHMATHLYSSIMLYTSNAIYAALNKVLRDENRSGVKKYFPYLRLFFEAFKHLPQNKRQLWRGISVDLSPQYTVGTTVTWWGVSSCTSDEQVARNFMRGCGGKCSFLTIDTKTAVDISSITFYSNEKESLLAPGTQLLVKSVKINGLVSEIHLEEVGNAVS